MGGRGVGLGADTTREGDALMRACLLVVAWASLLTMSCGGDGRARCNGGEDQTTCGSGEICLWLHLGTSSGYFCATPCTADKTCAAGKTCKEGAASSCDVCQNLIDICE